MGRQKICSGDCFHCEHPDCILDELRAEDYDAARLADREHLTSPERKAAAAKQRAYYAANREEIAAKQRAYREANREEIAAKRRARRSSLFTMVTRKGVEVHAEG